VVVFYRHDADKFPFSGEMYARKISVARRIFSLAGNGDADASRAALFASSASVKNGTHSSAYGFHRSIDEADFCEHIAELGFLHIERDNRLPSVWNIVTKLFPEFAADIQ